METWLQDLTNIFQGILNSVNDIMEALGQQVLEVAGLAGPVSHNTDIRYMNPEMRKDNRGLQ